MPTLSDDAFGALRQAIQQIDFRAKRQVEWRNFGLRTQNAESRFDVFLAILKGSGQVPSENQQVQLASAWTDCDAQLIELALLPDSFESITVLLKDGSTDATLRTWVDRLVECGRRVGEDLAQKRFGELPQHASEYKAAFTKLSIERNAKVESEINQLSTLTNVLVQKVQATV